MSEPPNGQSDGMDAEAVRTLLAVLCPNTKVTSIRDGPKSYSNQLWLADTDEGDLLIRIPKRSADPEYLRGSIVANRRAAEAGVPVSRFRAFAPSTALGRPAVVQEFQRGERATDLVDRDPGAVPDLAAALGHWVGGLHTVRRPSFGRVLEVCGSSDWRAVVRARVISKLGEMPPEALPADATAIRKAFENLLQAMPIVGHASLVHGDLYFDNILVRDGRAACLLDFEHARFYDRFAEFGKLDEFLFEPFPHSEQPFMEAYWQHFPPEPDDVVRRALAVGQYELASLDYFGRWQPDLVPTYRNRLRRWLTNL
jgi:aminoglycoside phosphotransferase (APT) family kinase protein